MNIIKSTIYLGTIALMATGFSHQTFADGGMQHHNNKAEIHEHGSMSPMKEMGAMGTGVLNKIMLDDKKINVTHEAIPDLNWPAMTMDLDVSEGVDLEALSPDDAIQFHIELGGDKVYRITKIMKADVAHHEGQQCEAGMDCPMHEDMKHGAE